MEERYTFYRKTDVIKQIYFIKCVQQEKKWKLSLNILQMKLKN